MSESAGEEETLGSQDTSNHYSSYEDDVSTMSRASAASSVGSIAGRMGSLHVADAAAAASGKPPVEELHSKKPHASSSSKKKNRVQLNIKRSQLDRFFHVMNPEADSYANERFATMSLKLQPALVSKGLNAEISPNGRKAKLKFEVSEKLCVPSNLLGTELAEDHVLNQAVQHEIDSRRDRKI
ncbi:predicted protein [Chaetoceros tenuissimus]|uniref:Uncharacterized protein n=1 Tax=Chaetoceros tenuissimus TaxID=426638 RepID=A0AAD3CUA2_9STRA|nr:predicted protein [Chaetoceros tenuissimus]